ncbi:unnamed protein product [Withania somnifera]
MAKAILTLFCLLLLSYFSVSRIPFLVLIWGKTWCVAKPSSDETTLKQNLNYACSNVDCSVLREGCPCFTPNNLMNHASIAMNLYYQAKGRNYWNCHFGNYASLSSPIQVSYDECTYA